MPPNSSGRLQQWPPASLPPPLGSCLWGEGVSHGDRQRGTLSGPSLRQARCQQGGAPRRSRSPLGEALQEGLTHQGSWDWSVPCGSVMRREGQDQEGSGTSAARI